MKYTLDIDGKILILSGSIPYETLTMDVILKIIRVFNIDNSVKLKLYDFKSFTRS